MKLMSIALALANMLCWAFFAIEETRETPEELQIKIENLKKTMPELENLAEWTCKAQKAIEAPPSANINEILVNLRAFSILKRFSVTESANSGGEPPRLIMAGHGSYLAGAAIITEFEQNRATKVDKISFEVRDDQTVETRFEGIVRNGPWEGQAPDAEKPDFFIEDKLDRSLGKVNIFGVSKAPEPKVTRNRPRIKYLGFLSCEDKNTVIIEENGKMWVLGQGEMLPSNCRIGKATMERVEIIDKGNKWFVSMEKPKP